MNCPFNFNIGRFVNRPYKLFIFYNHNHMHVVLHDNKFIQCCILKFDWNSFPKILNDQAKSVIYNFPIFCFSKQTTMLMRTNGDKIITCIAVIIMWQANGMAIRFFIEGKHKIILRKIFLCNNTGTAYLSMRDK